MQCIGVWKTIAHIVKHRKVELLCEIRDYCTNENGHESYFQSGSNQGTC